MLKKKRKYWQEIIENWKWIFFFPKFKKPRNKICVKPPEVKQKVRNQHPRPLNILKNLVIVTLKGVSHEN